MSTGVPEATVGNGLAALEIQRSDLRYEAMLAQPAFDMLLAGRSFAPVFAALRPLGLRLEDMKVEGQQPTEQALACYLFEWRTVVRYRFDRVEVQAVPHDVGLELVGKLIEAAVAVVLKVSGSKLEHHTFNTALHGKLVTGAIGELLAKHVTTLRHTETQDRTGFSVVPAGCTLRVAQESGARGHITLEESASVAEGAFVRVFSLHSGSLHSREACEQAISFFEIATNTMGIGVDLQRS